MKSCIEAFAATESIDGFYSTAINGTTVALKFVTYVTHHTKRRLYGNFEKYRPRSACAVHSV